MNDKTKQLEELTEIRSLMERSTQFLSLSGLSGVCAGIFALTGASLVYFDMFSVSLGYVSYRNFVYGEDTSEILTKKITFLLLVGIIVLILSLITGLLFTVRKAKRDGLKLWSASAKRMLINLAIPLFAGGVFCIILIHHELVGLIAPVTLIFYGLALINAGKYTFRDIRYLGIFEVFLGLISSYFIGYGLLFWAIGFGFLHIIYGTAMYFKYERKKIVSEEEQSVV